MSDLLAELGALALGSRLKRIAERLQSEVAVILGRDGYPIAQAHFPILAALDADGPLGVVAIARRVGMSQPGVTRSVEGLVELGVVALEPDPNDRRGRIVHLTKAGHALVQRMRLELWPIVGAAASDLIAGPDGPLLDHLQRLERRLDNKTLEERTRMRILDFRDDLAQSFMDINIEWISAMYTVEPVDLEVLKNPRASIIDKGGAILFGELPDLGVVGACALKLHGDGAVELTKMGVLEKARGRKVGEALLRAAIARARNIEGADTLFLLTNKKSAAAIHLYEKLGFEHDAEIMRRFGAGYARCDVAMRYRGRSDC